MKKSVIKLLLKHKYIDDFRQEYIEYLEDNETEDLNIYTKNGDIDAAETLSKIMAKQMDYSILANVVWMMKEHYVRIYKIKNLLSN